MIKNNRDAIAARCLNKPKATRYKTFRYFFVPDGSSQVLKTKKKRFNGLPQFRPKRNLFKAYMIIARKSHLV